MADIIKLLPDAIANQIAAGEVIQRPASVVKELMENALDAGADHVQVIIRDAGKALIQIVDNGMGMSPPDARMSFERHATSKIRAADDLFAIRTMGFRGEALASIAAIAQVEMRTRRTDDELGTRLVIEGSRVATQEPCQSLQGTNIQVRNLFFNVPARRKFLKSDPVEFRHIADEFSRIVLAHPEIAFSLHHNDNEVYILPKSNFRQRIVNLLGKKFNEVLVPVSEETNYVEITGFVGKPEAARKARGDQFLFVNRRFIKSAYLHHAVRMAYDEMIPEEVHPMYALYLEVDPARIDVNVHPTKQEIKFEDERLIYNYLRVSVRHALGKYSVTPSLDFEQEQAFQPTGGGSSAMPSSLGTSGDSMAAQRQGDNLRSWESLYEGLISAAPESRKFSELIPEGTTSEVQEIPMETLHVHGTFVVSQVKSGMLIIDQQAAHQRILYERYLREMETTQAGTQKTLFPETFELNAADAEVFREILEEVNRTGFDVQEFGGGTFIIHGVPALLGDMNPADILHVLLTRFIEGTGGSTGIRERIARGLSESSALRPGQPMAPSERLHLIESLFACENPYATPGGKKCFAIVSLDEMFNRLART